MATAAFFTAEKDCFVDVVVHVAPLGLTIVLEDVLVPLTSPRLRLRWVLVTRNCPLPASAG